MDLWNPHITEEVELTVGLIEEISVVEVQKALLEMKTGKACGPSGL